MEIWISSFEAADALQISKQALHKARLKGSLRSRPAGTGYEFLLSGLPETAQERYLQARASSGNDQGISDAEMYSSAPEHARRKADKYLALISASEGIDGKAALREFCAKWNQDHPKDHTSYARLYDARKGLRDHGISYLLGKWGKRSGSSRVPDELFSFFKSCYLTQGQAGAVLCWKLTLGYASEHGLDTSTIPSHTAFMRRLENSTPKQAVYYARKGPSAHNKKYGLFIPRDMSTILAGECWVSDHAQLDIAASYINNQNREAIAFPWITVFCDFKSWKYLGWDLYIGGPSSDNIFMSFYRGSVKWGVPSTLYVDNGRDFRSKMFTGGHRTHRLDMDTVKTTAMTANLGIRTIFARIRNAQAKIAERTFKGNKDSFSRLSEGFRGGNSQERPEALKENINGGKIMPFDELVSLFERFIGNISMETAAGKGLREGKSPNEIWNEEYPIALEKGLVKQYTKDSLMLFCSKTSSIREIGRDGFYDSELKIWYYDAWMEGHKGRKAYARRDRTAMEEAWIFDALTNNYLGQAYYFRKPSGLARTKLELEFLKQQLSVQNSARKTVKMLSKPDCEVPFSQKIALLETATRVLNDRRGYIEKPAQADSSVVHATAMDRAVAKKERLAKEGTADLSYMDLPQPKKEQGEKIYQWEWEKEEDLQQKVG